jgi:hypothetical protein
LFGVLVDGGVTVVTMSFEATLKAEDDIGKRRNYRQKVIGVIVILFLSALAFYGFQSIARVEEYERIVAEGSVHDQTTALEEQNELSSQLNGTFDEIRELRRELQKAREQINAVEEKHLALLADIQANTKAMVEAQTDAERGTAAEALSQAIEGDAYHRWMLDRRESLPRELREYVAPRELPFGFNPALHSDKITASVGHACVASLEDITSFMSYEVGKVCPDDDNLAQKLLLSGCEPLPRRR